MNQLAEDLLAYYDEHARVLPFRVNPQAYHIWLSEIMSQQTRMETVVPYFNRFIKALPRVEDLAQVDDEKLMKLWEGLGYYSRARNLKKAAQVILKDFGGQVPDNYRDLLKLPGVGPYTAGAIASIAFNQPVPAVDGNVSRVFSRLYAYGEPLGSAKSKRFIEEAVKAVIPVERPGDFNQAVMELGARICLPNGAPLCKQCPIKDHCLAFNQGNPLDYPLIPEKKARTILAQTVLLIRRGDEILLEKRPPEGLLAGQWQFPMVAGHLDERGLMDHLWQRGFHDVNFERGPKARHIFSHREWHMESYRITCRDLSIAEDKPGKFWHDSQDLEKIALPTAFKVYRQEAQSWLESQS